MLELDAILDVLAGEQDIRALIIISGKEDNFIAGVDINEIKGKKDVLESVLRKPSPTAAHSGATKTQSKSA